MKVVLAAVLLAAVGCRSGREISVELVSAQLIKIDTIYRYSGEPKQLLRWRDVDNIEYVSIVAMNKKYPLGLTLNVLRQR